MPVPAKKIHDFAREGDIPGVLHELANGTQIDVRDPKTGRSALMDAAASPMAGVDVIHLLIQNGANVNAWAEENELALPTETIESLRANIEKLKLAGLPDGLPYPDAIESILGELQTLLPGVSKTVKSASLRDCVLSLVVHSGSPEKIEALLDAGADLFYRQPNGYGVLINAVTANWSSPDLLPILRLLISRGARLNDISVYSESALKVASNNGRFDAVRLLLDAGSDPAPLKWTPLMHAVALGTLDDVKTQLAAKPDIHAKDCWDRTAWLLSLQVGDIPKSRLLLTAGANRADRGRCGRPPLFYPVRHNDAKMLEWLLSEGFDVDATDQFEETALIEATWRGAVDCARILIDAGAKTVHVSRTSEITPIIERAANIKIARLLVKTGADLNDISDRLRAELTGLRHDGILETTEEDYLTGKHRRFGSSNPEKMNDPFWNAMVACGTGAYAARTLFGDESHRDGAVWCFQRFGKSINELPNGRIIEVAGEHEDSYDADFCIYNDVIVHHGNGRFDIYGYPEETFPPTDFHTATLYGSHLYLIGTLGYFTLREPGKTQVFRLDTNNFKMERMETTGDDPGWISRHKAKLNGNEICVTGGKICDQLDGKATYEDNPADYSLNLKTLIWARHAKRESGQ